MRYQNIITATTTQVYTGPVKHIRIVNNADLTGTVTICDAIAGTTSTHGVVTNPTVGLIIDAYGFQNGVRIVTNATCDITVYIDKHQGQA